MIEINLLPKGYRKKQVSFSFGKTGLYAVVAAAGVVLMLVSVTVYQMNQVASLDDGIVKASSIASPVPATSCPQTAGFSVCSCGQVTLSSMAP